MNEKCKYRDNIDLGATVKIAVHRDSPESYWLQGIVQEKIDTNKKNEDGSLVKIENNVKGHVKEIILPAPHSSEDNLTEAQIMKMLEDVRNGNEFETRTFELKETFWYDVNRSEHAHRPIRNFQLEYTVVEEVCSFLNTNGGYVLIGVSNSGDIKGITPERDLQWMEEGKKDVDHFADMISIKLASYFDDEATHSFVHVTPQAVQGIPIIVIYIEKSYKPFFFIRKGTFKDDYFNKQVEHTECIIRRETGKSKISFSAFIEYWLEKIRS